MSSLDLKTKINFYAPSSNIGKGLSFNYHIPLPLKDGTILLYNNNTISLLTRKLSHKELFRFEEQMNENEINIIRNIKQLKCGDILCCNKKLYVFNNKSKNISPKIMMKICLI